ncbi:MAG TPA: IS256 family transposase [Acidobacteriaceae bacterium]|jgi:transposase-like protein|nr:IS256 family transposase [Acidobacteriaceae bacterium]
MAKDRIDRNELADKLVETATAAEDPLRAMAEILTDFLMEAEVTAKVGAEPHERNAERTTHRNGYRERRWDTRLGSLTLNIPKVRDGGYVPSFIEHRKRSEQALISVIQEAVVKGVSTRKIESVLEQLGIAGISAGQVSQLCETLDDKVRQFRDRPLGESRYVWVDALYEKVRVDERVESMAVVIATGVNPEGRREVLGFDVVAAETEESWTAFFKKLKERGLNGVKLVISDAHKGLTAAIRKILKAEWQRCKVHFYRNVLVHVPKRSQAEVSEAMKAVLVQRDEKSAKAKAAELARQFQTRFAKAMEIFEAGIDDVLSYLHYPQPHRVRVSSTNPLERLNLELRRRTRVVGIFPHTGACLRLIGMLLVEKHEDWLTDDKAYLTFDDASAEESAVKVVSMAVGQ